MKKYLSLFLLGIMLICTACSNAENSQIQSETETISIIIPETYLKFTRADIEDTAEDYKKYCTDVKIEEFNAVDSKYNCELSPDYSSVVYEFDEKLYEKERETKGHIQAGILLGVTSTHVLNGILENQEPDWKIQLVVKNCHTGNVVVEVNLPEGDSG